MKLFPLQELYDSYEQYMQCVTHGDCVKYGFDTPKDLWDANPKVEFLTQRKEKAMTVTKTEPKVPGFNDDKDPALVKQPMTKKTRRKLQSMYVDALCSGELIRTTKGFGPQGPCEYCLQITLEMIRERKLKGVEPGQMVSFGIEAATIGKRPHLRAGAGPS